MGGVCPNARENGQISPSTTDRAARGSRPHLVSFFQGSRKSANIHASSGVIWGIPGSSGHTLAPSGDSEKAANDQRCP